MNRPFREMTGWRLAVLAVLLGQPAFWAAARSLRGLDALTRGEAVVAIPFIFITMYVVGEILGELIMRVRDPAERLNGGA